MVRILEEASGMWTVYDERMLIKKLICEGVGTFSLSPRLHSCSGTGACEHPFPSAILILTMRALLYRPIYNGYMKVRIQHPNHYTCSRSLHLTLRSNLCIIVSLYHCHNPPEPNFVMHRPVFLLRRLPSSLQHIHVCITSSFPYSHLPSYLCANMMTCRIVGIPR